MREDKQAKAQKLGRRLENSWQIPQSQREKDDDKRESKVIVEEKLKDQTPKWNTPRIRYVPMNNCDAALERKRRLFRTQKSSGPKNQADLVLCENMNEKYQLSHPALDRASGMRQPSEAQDDEWEEEREVNGTPLTYLPFRAVEGFIV